ncbi:MAG: hypothetical protein WCO94_05165 [Verrucomicrobiota bacterium]
MTYPLWLLFIGWTLGGLLLPFFDRGAFDWWDKVWVALFAVAAYAGIAARSGLSSARVCASVVFVSFAAALAAAVLCGPLAPHFTPQAGPKIAGVFPLLPPLLLFALLSASERVTADIFPCAGRAGHAAWTALGFAICVVNGLAFLEKTRGWWVENPGGDGWSGAVAMTTVLACAAFALAFVYPVDSRMRLNRLSAGLVAWLSVNGLFLVANFAMFLK